MDIQYFEYDFLSGVQHFHCDRILARLSTTACAGNWRLASDHRAGDVAVLRDERQQVQFRFQAAESVRQLVEGVDRGRD